MSFFRKKAPELEEQVAAHSGSRKIILNFGGMASKDVETMAAATLEAGGYAEQPPREQEPGDKMPDGTIYAGVSPDTGKAMYATPADAPLSYTFNEARKYAKDLDVHGHKDWRVPTPDELNVLFNNRAAIGGFNVTGSIPAGWYWSSSHNYELSAWGQRFSSGCRDNYGKGVHSSVRCVR